MARPEKPIKPSRKRSKKLRETDVEFIANLIAAWPDNAPTWDDVIARVKTINQQQYTRQALSKHQKIALAFELRKSRPIKARAPRGSVMAQEARDRIEALLATIELKDKIIETLRERFVRWAYNANGKKMTEAMLDAPLVDPRRGNLHQENEIDLRRKL